MMADRDELFAELLHFVHAAREGELTDADRVRLESLVTESDHACDLYLELMNSTLDLEAFAGENRRELHDDETAGPALSKIAKPSPCSAKDKSALLQIYCFFARPTPASMAIAALVIGLILTAMAFMVPPFYRAIAGIGGDDVEEKPDSLRIVAELSKVHQAVWASEQLEPSRGAFLQAGREMQLEQGLAEIEFRDGATVTIEGPARWSVESEGVLRLESGRIVANVPTSAIGFTVLSPGMNVEDLGTEFGLTAGTAETEVHVFQGEVAASLFNTDGDTHSTIKLIAGQSIVWDTAKQEVARQPSQESNFVQRVPTPEQFTIHSTGVNIELGQADPYWVITALAGDESFQPQNATVTSLAHSLPNELQRSQWISNGHPAPVAADNGTYTFATKFNLSGFDADTAVLRVWFAVDNLVTAIRLNGEEIPVPRHEYSEQTFKEFMSLNIADGFLADENTLEFDVFNANDQSRMGLRVEMIGRATRPVEK